jgi:hypothetical protein
VDLRVYPDARDVNERDFEAALERPELVSAPDVQRQFALCYRQIHQRMLLWLTHVHHDRDIEFREMLPHVCAVMCQCFCSVSILCPSHRLSEPHLARACTNLVWHGGATHRARDRHQPQNASRRARAPAGRLGS